jgi:autotransporter-associated beta strand protein
MQAFEALSLLSGGHENDAWTQFFELGHKRVPAGSPPFAIAPIYFAQVAVGDLELAKAQTRGQAWPGWYAPMLDLFAGIGTVAWRGAAEGTGSLAAAGAALGRQADWSAGFAPFAAKVSADVAAWSALHSEVEALGRAGRAPEAWNLLARQPSLRTGLLRRVVVGDLARAVEANATGAWPAKGSSDTVAMLATADIRPLDLDVGADLTIDKPLATGPIVKTGAGTLTLTGPQPFAGGLEIREGRVVVKGGGWTEPSGAGRGTILVSTGAVLETTGTHQFDGSGSQTELRLRGGRAVFPNECYLRILDLCGGRLETKRDVRIRYEVRVWASQQPSEVAGALAGMLRNDPIKVFVEDGPASPDFRLGESRGTGIRKEGPGQMELSGPVENTLVLGSGSLRWPAIALKVGRVEGRGIVLRPVATSSAQASLDVQGQASFVNKLVIEPIDEAGKGWKPDAPVRWAVIRAMGGLTCDKAPEAPPGWKIETDANAVYVSYSP